MAAMTSIFANRIKPAQNRLNPNPTLRLPITHIIRRGHVDNAILYHDRLLSNLYTLEKRYQASGKKIFERIQSDIEPWMRRMVTSWLLEVCEEIQMEQEVYFTAVNMTDRILSELYFKRDHFQLVGTAALMIASKLKETLPIMPDKMVLYTDNSVSFDDLIQMEQIILSQLVWDVSCPTVIDFIDIFCQRSINTFGNDKRTVMRIKQLAHHISQKAVIEPDFIDESPSTIAAASVCVAAYELLPQVPVHAATIPVHKLSPVASITASPDKSSGYATSCDNSSADASPANLQTATHSYENSIPIVAHPYRSTTQTVQQNRPCGWCSQNAGYTSDYDKLSSSCSSSSASQRGNAPSNPMQGAKLHGSRSNSDSSLTGGDQDNVIYNAVSRQLWENGTNLGGSDCGHHRTGSCSSVASTSSSVSRGIGRSPSASTNIKLRVQYKQRSLGNLVVDMQKVAGNELRRLIPAINLIGSLKVWKLPVEDLSHLLPKPCVTIPPPPKRQSLSHTSPKPLQSPNQVYQAPKQPPPGLYTTTSPLAQHNAKQRPIQPDSKPIFSQPKTTAYPTQSITYQPSYYPARNPYTPNTSTSNTSADSSSSSLAAFCHTGQAPQRYPSGTGSHSSQQHLDPHKAVPDDDLENIESILSSLFPDNGTVSEMLI